MIEDFLDMMADEVLIAPWVAQNAHGEAVYGPAVAYRARIEVSPRLTRDAQGEEVVSTARVFLGSATVAVRERDQLTLPEGFTERRPNILRVSPVRDEAGVHHTEIWC